MSEHTWLIHTHGGGRFGNQLTLFSHLIALACARPEFSVVSVPFWPYAAACRGTARNPLCAFSLTEQLPPARVTAIGRIVGLLKPLMPGRVRRSLSYRLPPLAHRHRPRTWGSYDRDFSPTVTRLDDPAILAEWKGHAVMLTAGFDFRDWEAFERHQSVVRTFLMPSDEWHLQALKTIGPLRSRYSRLIGLMIRRTDYQSWRGGEFYFSLERYAGWIRQLKDRFGPETGFLLAGDDPTAAQHFARLDCHWAGGSVLRGGHPAQAMIELGACDVVASVPSTFAAYAAFFGQKPILPLWRDGDPGCVSLLPDFFAARKDPIFSMALV